ncbi:inositol monophosphatase family protein [Planotetraspora kaengkrachanensis]|uniref:Inositol monophosphatase n=1 Tax=Planotetraspora kaengkrachanensis TaxID=575193 RepID=A0A8J3PWQ0_9ACTN|nr:inositol monophosphatase [Planotetraspora kaengkrachanensis]GIG82463.1 inositol monophosphatase [Planotetraspora kaengkrachanensis]
MATEVDYAVEDAVRDFLARETPEIGFLGEEEGVTGSGDQGLIWALDPVDGTANFTHGIPLCGISLGLVEHNRSVLGVIELPFLDSRYSAAEGAGATRNGEAIQASKTDTLEAAIVAVGDYAVGADAEEKNRLRVPLNYQLAMHVQRVRMYGSAALDLAWVAEGKTDACITLSNKPWDMAAGVAIAREAGSSVVDIDGSSHSMTATATIATSPKILADLLALINKATNDAGRR